MQVQIVSDLHLELERPRKQTYQYELPVNAPNLVLLGNIGLTVDEKLFVWLKTQLTRFRTVFYVSGNKGTSSLVSRLGALIDRLFAWSAEQWGSSVVSKLAFSKAHLPPKLTSLAHLSPPIHTTIHLQIESAERLRAFARHANQIDDPSSGTFVYLNRNRHDVDHTLTILGCTLWTQLDWAQIEGSITTNSMNPNLNIVPNSIPVVLNPSLNAVPNSSPPSFFDASVPKILEDPTLLRSLHDFRRISSFTPATYATLHMQDLRWLNATIAEIGRMEPHRKIVVFTHFAPTIEGAVDPRMCLNEGTGMVVQGSGDSKWGFGAGASYGLGLGAGYGPGGMGAAAAASANVGSRALSANATELTGELCWKSGKVKLWAFGHTLWCADFEREEVRVATNQRGLWEECKGYDPGKVVELPAEEREWNGKER